MTLDSGWVGAIGSLASAVIVAIAAIAAFIQIRHFRNANDIAVYLRLTERLDSEEARAAIRIFAEMRARYDADPMFREKLTQPGDVDADYLPIGLFLRFIEHMATLVITGGIAERIVLAEYADNLEGWWDDLRPIVYARRHAFGECTGAAFEHLAMRAKAYRESGRMARLYTALERDPRGAG